MTVVPAYQRTGRNALRDRAERAVAGLAACRSCPHACGVNRLENRWSICKTGRHAVVGAWFPHFGEERCLRGTRGSGTIFFAHCNLRCVFCRSFDVSQRTRPGTRGSTPSEIAAMALDLQARGCHNVNLVTPEHVVPQVIEAVAEAAERGLTVPLVYNTGAYDAPDSLGLLEGLVDIYMPDLKVWTPAAAKRYLLAVDYPEAARVAIREMHRQVGPLEIDEDGIARRGVLLRHLVMPGMLDETRAVLQWTARELGPDTYVHLMGEYRPAGKVGRRRCPEIDRGPTAAELREAATIARDLGLRRLDTGEGAAEA